MGLEQNKKTSMWENVMMSPIAVYSNLKKITNWKKGMFSVEELMKAPEKVGLLSHL